jgi:O-antigen/teichoic acid export membrane protein
VFLLHQLFFLNQEQLGLYSIAILAFSAVSIIPQTISQVFYFKMSNFLGFNGNINSMLNYSLTYTKTIVFFTSIVSLGSFILFPMLVSTFIPNYTAGIEASKILIIGVSFYSSTFLFSDVFTILKLNKQLIYNSLIVLIFNTFFSLFLVFFFGEKIEIIAYGASGSYIISSFLIMNIFIKKFNISLFKMLKSTYFQIIFLLIPGIFISTTFSSLLFIFPIITLLLFLNLLIFFKKEVKFYITVLLNILKNRKAQS